MTFITKYLALLILIAAIFTMFKSSDEPILSCLENTFVRDSLLQFQTGNTILFNLSVGYIVSFMFYLMIVAFPDYRKRQLYKHRLKWRYKWFKESVIRILINCYEDYRKKYDHENSLAPLKNRNELEDKLLDYKEFRTFFMANEQQNWYAVLNGIQYETEHLPDLYIEFQLLADEIFYVLNSINLKDDRAVSFFQNFFAHTHRLKNLSVFSDDQAKYFGGFLWEIFAQYSMIDGQLDKDRILEAISQI